jgi:hypothetical protein
MEIEYTLSEDDLMSFAMYQVDHAPAYRQRRRNLQVAYAVGFLLLALGTWGVSKAAILPAIFIAIGFFFVLLGPVLDRWRVRRHVARVYHQRESRGVYSKCTLRVTPEGLEQISDQGESRVKWSAVDRIVSTASHTLIYLLADTDAIVIPKDAIEPDQYDAFVKTVRQYQSEATA